MSWTIILTVWVVLGLIGSLISIVIEWYQHELFEAKTGYIVLDTTIQLLLGALLGPIALAIVIYEKFIDTV